MNGNEKRKRQLEEQRGITRIKNHPRNTARTKDGQPIVEMRPPITRAHAEFMKSNDGAIFLSQCIYWQATKKPHEYFYKSVREWQEELLLSRRQVEKFRAFLVDEGILDYEPDKRANGHPTGHYRVNQKRFDEVFQDFLDNEFVFPNEGNADDVLDAEILEVSVADDDDNLEVADVETESISADKSFEIVEGQPFCWLIEEIQGRGLSEADKVNERVAFNNILHWHAEGLWTEADFVKRAEGLCRRGIPVTATTVARNGI